MSTRILEKTQRICKFIDHEHLKHVYKMFPGSRELMKWGLQLRRFVHFNKDSYVQQV